MTQTHEILRLLSSITTLLIVTCYKILYRRKFLLRYDTALTPPKGISGVGTLDSPFIFPDNRMELTDYDVQNILTYQTFCAEKYKEINQRTLS